jgi:putative ABC transport system ATP-binding protein
MIEVENLERIYAMGKVKVQALKGVSFDVKKGEFLAIMGASGSGKSTLLHQLGLLDTPTAGKIFID